MLGLPGLVLLDAVEVDGELHMMVETTASRAACPEWGGVGALEGPQGGAGAGHACWGPAGAVVVAQAPTAPRLSQGLPGLADLTLARIRLWHGELVKEHPALAPKAYRLLKTILNAAVEDRRLVANPCQIKGAAAEHPDERPVATVAEVDALADAVPPRYRALVLLAAWCSLRFGELAALTRQRANPIQGWAEVQQTLTETDDGRL